MFLRNKINLTRHGLFQSVPPVQMSEVLIDHHNFIHEEDSDAFTEFGLMVRDSCPDTLVEVLVSLIKASKMSLAQVLSMFISSFVSVSSLNSAAGSSIKPSVGAPLEGASSGSAVTHNTAMMQLFLETYFTGKDHPKSLNYNHRIPSNVLLRYFAWVNLIWPKEFINKI